MPYFPFFAIGVSARFALANNFESNRMNYKLIMNELLGSNYYSSLLHSKESSRHASVQRKGCLHFGSFCICNKINKGIHCDSRLYLFRAATSDMHINGWILQRLYCSKK